MHFRFPLPLAAHRLLATVSALAVGLALLAVAPAASAQTDVTPARVGGESRYHTAANIATLTFQQADVAHLVTGRNFPDALAGTFAAGSVDGPLLLTSRTGVPAPTLQALEALGVQRVVLIGGTGVIGPAVEQQVAAAGYATDRLGGHDRYETAATVASHYGRARVGTVAGQRAAILATGVDFPDALAAGPIAARERLPLLLTPHGRADASVNQALEQLAIDKIYLLGGPLAISEDVEAFYRDRGYEVERVGGPTRMDTAWLVADTAVHDFGFTHELVLLARGDDYPDALAASVHGAALGAPIVLTATATDLSQPTRDWLTRTCPDIRALRAVGGTAAVSVGVLNEAVAAAEACDDTPAGDTAVAVADDGRVVVLDASTGEEIRQLMAGVRTDDPAKNDIAVTPDQRHAYVAVPAQNTADEEEIVRVPVAGGDPELIAAGASSPAVSPDGSTLAYAVHVGPGPGDPDPRLVLRNLVTGQEVRFTSTDQPLQFISDVEWTADGSEVVFTAGEINTGVYAVDRNATSMQDARRLGPGTQPQSGVAWRSIAAFGDGLAVVEMCCDVGEQRWHIIAVDPIDGSVAGRLVPQERIEATSLDSNAAATELLIVELDGPTGGPLLRWNGSGSPQTVAHDIIVAAW